MTPLSGVMQKCCQQKILFVPQNLDNPPVVWEPTTSGEVQPITSQVLNARTRPPALKPFYKIYDPRALIYLRYTYHSRTQRQVVNKGHSLALTTDESKTMGCFCISFAELQSYKAHLSTKAREGHCDFIISPATWKTVWKNKDSYSTRGRLQAE